ncbi:hypothetical protein JCM8097_004844 [Rhodosporidiobolus ruineniae]
MLIPAPAQCPLNHFTAVRSSSPLDRNPTPPSDPRIDWLADPWAKREAWRKSPIFSNRAMFRNLFPGFGIAVVAFTAYVAYDETVNAASKKAHHGDGHH